MVTSDVSRLAAALTASAVLHGIGLYSLSTFPAGGGGAAAVAEGHATAINSLQVTIQSVSPVVSAENKTTPVLPVPDTKPTSSNPPSEPQFVLPGLHYFRLSEVDNPPAPLGDIVPDTAVRAQLGQREGYLVLRLFISETGTVDRVEVVQARPPGVFDQVEVPVFSAARFAPAVKNGKPVRSQIVAEIRYFDETEIAQSSRASPLVITPVTPLR